MINVGKLHAELVAAGIETCGCDCNGIVWSMDNKEIQDLPKVKAVIAKHDPTPEPEETLEEKIRKIAKEEIEKDKNK